MEFLKKVYHVVAAVLLMLVTSLIYGGYILEWRGKRPLCILIAAMAVTAVLIALVCRYLKKYAGQIAVVCIVPMTFCLATGLYKLYMVAADGRSIFYLAMIFFAAAYFITEYLLNLCMENASLQNIRQFFNTHKWVLIFIFIAVLCRVPLLSQLPRWDSGEYYYRLILGTHHFEYTGFKEFVENYALCGHPTLGFCLVYLPGELAFSQEVIGVTLTSLILTALALWCVYRIFLKILPQVTEGKAAVCTFLLSKPISAYQLGEAYAQSMGVNIKVFRVVIILLSSILSACVTAFAGPISFVGIAVPFLTRKAFGTSKPIVVIPGTFFIGAVFCMICDLIARMALAPVELNISTVTSILGAPIVIYMMVKREKGRM